VSAVPQPQPADASPEAAAEAVTSIKSAAGGQLEAVQHFLEEQRPEAVHLRTQMDTACARLTRLQQEVQALRIPHAELMAQLRRAEDALGTEARLRHALQEVAGEVADDVLERVRIYERHINTSMSTEVSSCTPLADIAQGTRAALCDYALDPLNSMWMALALGVLLLLPIILLASSLNPLYHKTQAYSKYVVPSSSDCSPTDPGTFATDIYGLPGTLQHQQNGDNSRSNSNKHYQPMISQITSPYATSNYGYQELYPQPPAYQIGQLHGGTNMRR